MIISRTPYRISFFGGGTDYPPWFREHGGAVLATTINHYCYLTCRFFPPFFDTLSRVVWSKIELVNDHAELEHPAIAAILKELDISQGVEIHHQGDLPARSGLGSSSSFTVGLLHALYALQGRLVSKEFLAQQAIHVEQTLLAETVGVQDQIQTAFGGLNRILIDSKGGFVVQPLPIPEQRLKALEGQLLLLYTGVARTASDVANSQVGSMKDHAASMHEMRAMVDIAADILVGQGDLEDFGRLLHETWMLKRGLSAKIAPSFIDDIYARARAAGALGGKLLGAGGGGFMLFFVPPDRQESVLNALSELLVVPMEFERSGTSLIHYDPRHYSQTARSRRDYQRY